MNSSFLMAALAIVSALTSLTVEALKKILSDVKVSYNLLAAIVAVVLSLAASCGYLIYTGTAFTAQIGVVMVALMFLSFLASTVGYDKVVQMLKQIIGE